MKKILVFFSVMMLLGVSRVWAVDQTFIVSANVPATQSVGITVNRITGTAWALVPNTNLSFGTLTLNSQLGILLPNHYFVIDAAPQGPTNGFQVTYTYTEGSNPNAPNHGLGWKATATFMKASRQGMADIEAVIPGHGKKLLKDVNSELITAPELVNGWSRTYIGLVTKDPSAAIPDPAQGEPFNIGDKPGDFNGTLFVSAVAL